MLFKGVCHFMKALVTGATGFLGSSLARQLLARGDSVRILARASSPRDNLEGLDVEVVAGDLLDPSTLKEAVKGCDTLYHAAADYRLWTRDPAAMFRANVEGSVAILRAGAEAGMKRMVYTSSVAVLGLNKDGTPANEDTPVTFADMIGPYKQSKFKAEEAVRQLIADEGTPVVIVNPSTPIGPRDIKPTPTGKMIVDAAAGKMPAYVDTGLNIAHVDDVAEGHLLAYDKGEIGQRYILGGENMTLQSILTLVAEITGDKPPMMKLPHDLIMPIAYISEAWCRLTGGQEPAVIPDGVRMAKKKMFFTCDKAKEKLGYDPRPAADAIKDAVDWFKAKNYC